MYTFILYTHSWLRWIILILALITIYKSFVGWNGNKEYTALDKRITVIFVGCIHLMALLGLTLYFFYSPYAFNSLGGDVSVMKNPTLRFWSVEHVTAMITAITLITIGRVRSKKATLSKQKFKFQLIFFGIGLLIILSAIPYGEAHRFFRF